MPVHLPSSFLQSKVYRANRGGEGFVGQRYVQLWRAENLIELNKGYGLCVRSEPRLETRKPSTRAKWRSFRSACGRVLENCLTLPTLLEKGIYQQL